MLVPHEHSAASWERFAQNVDRPAPHQSLQAVCRQVEPNSAETPLASPRPLDAMSPEEAVDFIVDDCFFTVGQAIGDRKTVDVAAVIWWRNHYRATFLAAMRRFGNRWLLDRKNVKAVGRLLAERAVEYAGESASIDQRSAVKATADANRCCTLRAMRRIRSDQNRPDESSTWIAGYWCGDPGILV